MMHYIDTCIGKDVFRKYATGKYDMYYDNSNVGIKKSKNNSEVHKYMFYPCF